MSLPPDANSQGGVDAFIGYVSAQAAVAPAGWAGTAWFVLRISEDGANIQLRDTWQPMRMLRQMAAAPPLGFGSEGFKRDLVDDRNPARHYLAFVFVGFWLPAVLAMLVLYAWEVAGFVRYRGKWSQRDVACGKIGIKHGARVRVYGPALLPGLIAADLAQRDLCNGGA
jgi:hypothetical protein